MKIWMRIVSVLCILAAFATFFFLPSMTISGVKRKDLREFRATVLGDLDVVQAKVLDSFFYLKDDLDDNDLPDTKGGIKNRFKKTEALLRSLMEENVSFYKLFNVSLQLPGYIRDTQRLMETDRTAKLIFEASEYVYLEDAEETVDYAADYKSVFWLILIFFAALMMLTLATVILTIINKGGLAMRIVFVVVMALLVAALCVALPMAAEPLGELVENMELKITVFPFLAFVLSLIPIILGIVNFAQKKKQPSLQVSSVEPTAETVSN